MDILNHTKRMVNIYRVNAPVPDGKSVIAGGGAEAYMLTDGTLLIAGTNSRADWLTYNLRIGSVAGKRHPEGSKLPRPNYYRGFALYAQAVLDNLKGKRPKRIVGHSLGGAAAQILGVHLGVPVLALASPGVQKRRRRRLQYQHILHVAYEEDRVRKLLGQFTSLGKEHILARKAGYSRNTHSPADYLILMTDEVTANRLDRLFK